KIAEGAEYLVTQMFFRNEHYFHFVDRCREAGITVPILPGLKVITTPKHLTSLPRFFHCEIPDELAGSVAEAKREHVIDIGAEWAAKQAEGLIEGGAPAVHFYV